MIDHDDLEGPSASRYAYEWGLASTLLAGFLALGAPITLIFNVEIWLAYPRAIPVQFLQLLFYIGIVAMVFVVLACLIALFFGVRACRAASATGQPAALGVTGILGSLIALGAWLFVGIDLVMILGTYANVRL
jgi:hypothetical protein